MSSFTQVKALRPGRSVFDLSYEKKFDFDMGQIIPVCCEEMVPGDTFKFGNEIVINFQPMFAPVYHEINVYVHYFFVPTRLIFDGWESFITHGIDGNDETVLPRFNPSVPDYGAKASFGEYSPYDYFGFPVLKSDSFSGGYSYPGRASHLDDPFYFYRPLAFPWRCMNLVWNEYYRDETLQAERDLDNPTICYRNWTKDYFTSALPFQQRGTSPSLPLSGSLDVVFSDGFNSNVLINGSPGESLDPNRAYFGMVGAETAGDPAAVPSITKGSVFTLQGNDPSDNVYSSTPSTLLNNAGGKVDLGDALTFDVSDLRLAFQLQKFMERAARGGVRYTEFLTSFFGVAPTDARLQRPEYLGGSKSPIVVSQVLQTSQTSGESTPIGRLAGKGLTADRNYIGKYTASEFGYLCGYMTVMPKPTYQQGVDRKWLRKSFSDFYFCQFAHLSEQPVIEEEIFAFAGDDFYTDPVTEKKIYNSSVFGYQAPYNEMRMNKDMVCGSLRFSLDYWHLGRQFDTPPQLNSDFITMDPERDDLKRIFSVTGSPGLICNFGNIITAIRPLPKYGEPGFIDHS